MPNVIDRSRAEALIREQVVSTIFQDAPKQSVVMQLGRKLPNMTSKQTRIPVLSMLPLAYWVNGDTGYKQTSRQAWENVYLTAGELAVIVPIPEAVLADAEFDILGEVTPRVNEAIGLRVDQAILFGINRPAEWQNDIITVARQAGNNVSGGISYDSLLGENGLFAKVEDAGYTVDGVVAAMGAKASLRGIKDTNGNPLPDDEWYELKGSEYGKEETVQDYAVTYYRPTYSGADVQWKDNQGVKGKIDYLKQYHDQPSYYPAWIGTDSYTLYGPCLKSRTYDQSGNGSYWVNGEYDWGYADNFGNDRLSEDDNAAAGAMKVYFKISNAVDKNGQPANLKYIDFIRVQTGVNAKAGWLGENSTEVFGFTDENINQGK